MESPMKKIFLALSLATLSAMAYADTPQAVTITLSSGSTMTQGMAMVLANQMQDQGAQVNILLCDHAGDMALQGAEGEVMKPNDVTLVQLLDGALKKGASASVCALYLPNSGNSADDLREGISPANPSDMATELLEENRKVIGF